MRIRLTAVVACATMLGLAIAWMPTGSIAITRHWDSLRNVDTHGDSTRTHTYLLNDNGWLTFQLPPNCAALRLLTNANFRAPVPKPRMSQSRLGWRYSIEYELLNEQEGLTHSTYAFRTQVTELRDAVSGKTLTRSYYDDHDLVPAAAAELIFPVHRLRTPPTILRLKLLTHDTPIRDVGARVYATVERPGYAKHHTWFRKSHRSRELLARASVYPHSLLRERERQNLLRWVRLPVAPFGLEQRDYQRRVLYVRTDPPGEEVGPQPLPPGLYVGPELAGVIPLPNGDGVVALRFEPWEDSGAPAAFAAQSNPTDAKPRASSTKVAVAKWFGRHPFQFQERFFSWDSEVGEFEFAANGGLLEFSSQTPVMVRAFWTPATTAKLPANLATHEGHVTGSARSAFPMSATESGTHEITPKPAHILTYPIAEGPVQFRIAHLDERPTPFRLSVRVPKPSQEQAPTVSYQQSARVNWKMFAGDGSVVGEGILDCYFEYSRYDYVQLEGRIYPVADPTHFYFRVPSTVERLEFRSDEPQLIVNGATRPVSVRSVRHVPDDYDRFLKQDRLVLDWFRVRPENHGELMDQKRWLKVHMPPDSPARSDELLAKTYHWEDFLPAGPWQARRLLTRIDADAAASAQSVAVRFEQIPLAVDLRVSVQGRGWEPRVAPRLIVLSDSTVESTGELKIYVNGRLHDSFHLLHARSQLHLKPLPGEAPFEGTMRFECNKPATVLMNRVQLPESPQYLRRYAIRFDGNALEFDYHKRLEGEERLTLRYHAAVDRQDSIQISCDIVPAFAMTPPLVTKDWTMQSRSFKLSPHVERSTVVLGTANQTVDEGRLCFVKLNSDMPPGDYKIRLTREQTEPAYVILSRTIPGIVPDEAAHFETR